MGAGGVIEAQEEAGSERPTGRVDIRRADIFMAALLGLIGAIAAFKSIDLGPGWDASGPQPGFLPFVLGIIIAGNCVVILLKAKAGSGDGTMFEVKGEFTEVLRVGVPIAIAVALVETIGFYIMVAVYSAGFIIWYGRFRWYKVVPIAILFAFGLYRGLEGFFRVFMPKSMFYGDSFPL